MQFGLILFFISSTTALGCVEWNWGKPQSISAPGCFSVLVPKGQALQVLIQQPVDLEISVTSGAATRTIDSFDFGNETVTLSAAGRYQLSVTAFGSPSLFAKRIHVHSRVISAIDSKKWMAAEVAGRKAKLSKDDTETSAGITLWKATGDTASIARAFLVAGSLATTTNRTSDEVARYEDALRYCRLARDARCIAEAANNSGLASMTLGNIDFSLKRLEEARQHWALAAEPGMEARTMINLGLLNRRSGNFTKAIAYYNQARTRIADKTSVQLAFVENNLGMCYLNLGDFQQARTYFESAKLGFQRFNRPRESILAQSNLGRTFMLQGNLPQAALILTAAKTEAEQAKEPFARLDALLNLGQTLLKQNVFAEAKSVLTEALSLSISLKALREQAGALHYLGLASAASGDFSKAMAHLTQAASIRQKAGFRDPAVESLTALAKLELSAGRTADATAHAQQASRLAENVRSQVPGFALRGAYSSGKRPLYDLLVELAANSSRIAKESASAAFLASDRTKGRLILDTLAERQLVPGPAPALYNARTKIRNELDLLYAQFPSDPDKVSADVYQRIQKLNRQDEELEAELQAQWGTAPLGAPLSSVATLQRDHIPPGSAIVAYHLSETKSYLWFITDSNIEMFSLPAIDQISTAASECIRLFAEIGERRRNPKLQEKFTQSTRELSKLILGPLSPARLPDRLIVIPDGILHEVPFAALFAPRPPGNKNDGTPADSDLRLGLRHSILFAPNAAFLTSGPKPKPAAAFTKSILAAVDPVFTQSDPRLSAVPYKGSSKGLARLPFTFDVDEISARVSPARRSILRGFDADVPKLKQQLLTNFRVIHLASHALMDSEVPENSRVFLSMFDSSGKPINGSLRPRQFAEMHLDGSIVVISACESSLGKPLKGEGFAGFSHSLFFAGASQLVLSTTRVDAEGTSELFRQVYRSFFTPRQIGMEEALLQARRSLSSSRRWADPFYWASFSVTGRPSAEAKLQTQ